MDISRFLLGFSFFLWGLKFSILPPICIFLSISGNLLKTLPGTIWLVLHHIFKNVCACVHVCMCLSVCESIYVYTSTHAFGHQGVTYGIPSNLFETGSLFGLELTSYTDWLLSIRDLLSLPPCAKIISVYHYTWLLWGHWALNSGPHAC